MATDMRENPERGAQGPLKGLPRRLFHAVAVFYYDVLLYLANTLVAQFPNHRLRLFFYRRFLHWRIGRKTSVHRGCRMMLFPLKGTVEIGDHTCIGQNFYVAGPGFTNMSLRIGFNVNIAMDVFVTMGGHEIDPRKNFDMFGKPMTIEDHAVIFARSSIIMANIGRGAVVLPGSVVVHDVPPFTIVGGNPAKEIGKREPQEDPVYRLDWRWRFH